MNILKSAEDLWGAGFAIHWLHPNSKRPIEAGWTSGERKSWEVLKKRYHPGMNVGVRLGGASKIDGGYLSVIDCDVKSSLAEHRLEMEQKLKELFPKLPEKSPRVLTGRGNGSAHIYVKTSKPLSPKRKAQSPIKVKVKLDSKPSTNDKEVLTKEELAAGLRLRPAWEISLMGEGQQVVAPPSIHPDTGKAYMWAQTVKTSELAAKLPVIEESESNGNGHVGTNGANGHSKPMAGTGWFTPVETNLPPLVSSGAIVKEISDLIEWGTGCSDRSASIFKASIALIRGGLTDTKILSILTEPNYFLGLAAYEHAQTKDRERAAAWVLKYTLNKAHAECSVTEDFGPVVTEDHEPIITGEPDVRELLERTPKNKGYRVKNTMKNVVLILEKEVSPIIFSHNLFSDRILHGINTPWGQKKGTEFSDISAVQFVKWCADKFRFEPSKDRVFDAMNYVAEKNAFHPVRDYLDGLKWDGVPRANTWMQKYMGAVGDKKYVQAISRKTLTALVARIYEPGIKYDQVMILEGVQGQLKSWALRALAGNEWFSDTKLNIQDKDSVLTMQGKWIMEFGELAGMRKTDVETLKAFITNQSDRIRKPYGRMVQDFPRQCIFIGTTNWSEYLNDPTGNRRYWPITVGLCDVKGIGAARDQLFAEAKFMYEFGELLYLDDKDTAEAALEEQASRTFNDMWTGELNKWLETEFAKSLGEDDLTMNVLFNSGGPFEQDKPTHANQTRAGVAMRSLGFVSRQGWKKGVRGRHYVKFNLKNLPA